MAASQAQVAEVDFYETLVPAPAITISSPQNGVTYLVGTNQPLVITVDAEAATGHSIREVDYAYGTNGTADTVLGVSTSSPFGFNWTNALWATPGFTGSYTLTATAVDDVSGQSVPVSVNFIVALDADGNGLPDWWEIQYFGQTGLDPNSSPDGNGQTLLYDYQNGINPTDYYDGTVPTLQVTNGNWQVADYDSILSIPLTVLVTDANGNPLTNAPVVFIATNSAVQLVGSDDEITTNLTVRTDGNGLASVWGYVMPDTEFTNAESTIVARATSGGGSTQVAFTELAATRVGHWNFDTTQWPGNEGQLPMNTANLVLVPDWSTNALLVDNANGANLEYACVNSDGYVNFVPWNGTIRFWFKPDWNSATVGGGTGPGDDGRLFELGGKNNAQYMYWPYYAWYNLGWWTLRFSQDGTQLNFVIQQPGYGTSDATNLSTAIQWSSNDWHQVVLTYGPTNSSLYIDGVAVATNGLGVAGFPEARSVASGFFIGSDGNGNNQARGQFDELEIFDYPLTPDAITNTFTNYPALLPAIQVQPASQQGYVGQSVTFSVLASGDSPLNYQWYFNGYLLPFATNAALTLPAVQSGDAGSYAVTVANRYGLVTSSNAALTVAIPMTVTITNPIEGAVFVGNQADISMAATATDLAGNNITNVEFFDGTTSLGSVAIAPYNLLWSGALAGSHALRAVASDDQGLVVTSAVVHIMVDPVAVSITSPQNGTIFAVSETNLSLVASASDSGGAISQVQFFAGTTSLGVVTTAPYECAWTNVAAGNYALTAVAIDNAGFSATSSVVNITISPLWTSNNVCLWLRADALTGLTNNTPLAVWSDSSGRGNDATQNSPDSQPTWTAGVLNGLPVVHFNGVNERLILPDFIGGAAGGEAFVVLHSTTALGNSGALWSRGIGWNPEDYPDTDGTILEYFGGDNHRMAPDQPLNEFHVYNVCSQSNNWSAWINGQLLLRSSPNTVNFPNHTLILGGDPSFAGDIAEVLAFGRALSSDERRSVNEYLNAKYGLVAMVPPVPTNLTAVAVSPTQIGLTWHESLSGGATEMAIERLSTNDWSYHEIARVADTTSFVDTNLAPNTTYYYRVRAANLGVWSEYSAIAQAVTLGDGNDLPLGSLALWLKADAGLLQTSSNTTVGCWIDQSGHDNNAGQSTPGKRPMWVDQALNGRPVIHFDGNGSYFGLPNFMTGATSGEAFVIVRTGGNYPGGSLWAFGTAVYGIDLADPPEYNTSGITEDFGSSHIYNLGAPAQSLTNFNVYNVTAGADGYWAAWLDGALLYQTNNNVVHFGYSTIGNYFWHFGGDVAEILIFNRSLTVGERATVNRYLVGKYAYPAASVTITSPANNAALLNQTNVEIATSTSVGITAVEFFAGRDSLGRTTNAPYSLVWSNVPLGNYTLTARAENNQGLVCTSSVVNVTVGGIALTAPANNSVIVGPTNVALSAAVVAATGVSQVQFFAGTNYLGTATSQPYSLVWSNVSSGTYALTAVAVDSYGQHTTSSVVNVTMDVPPTVTLTSPVNQGRFGAGNLSLAASVADADGSVTQVEFFQGTTSLGVSTSPPYGLTWNAPSGMYALTARATDNHGLVSTSAVVNISVTGITITNPVNYFVTASPASVSIGAVAADDQSITQVQFFQGTTSLGTVTAPPYGIAWNGVSPGIYAVTAVATDAAGLVFGSNPITVIVDADPTTTDRNGDGLSDYIDFLEGANPLAGSRLPDANGLLNLEIYTPLQ